MSNTVQRTLCYAYFYDRLAKQLSSGELSALTVAQAQYSRMALFDGIVAELHKIVDTRKDTWNLKQLYKEWLRFEHDDLKKQRVLCEVETLEDKLARLMDYRNTHHGHTIKKILTTALVALPIRIPYLSEVVHTLDRFVSSPIPYALYLHKTGKQHDLRKLLNID